MAKIRIIQKKTGALLRDVWNNPAILMVISPLIRNKYHSIVI